jgi:putative transcriptional regulator
MDVARATQISRNMLAKLYYDRARRIDLGDLNKLCRYFSCSVGDLLESVPDRSAHREKKRKNISS